MAESSPKKIDDRIDGITLLSMLITVSLFMLMSQLAISYWKHFIVSHQLHALIYRMIGAIELARHEAMHRALSVRLCGSADQKQCDGQWTQGVKISLKSREKFIRYYPALPLGYRLIWRSNFGRNLALDFTPEGFTDGQQGAFYLCPPRKSLSYAWRLVINESGRLRLAQVAVYPSCNS